MLNLIDLLKTIPMINHDKIGLAISYGDIYTLLKAKGFDNKDYLDCELKKLSDKGIIQLFCMDDFDENLIYAVRFK